jgi:dTDP-4-amino-4,6-dideoxygalactose transaminase
VGTLEMVHVPEGVEWNYAYCSIFVKPEYPLSRDELYEHLKSEGIHPRRYFYPLISEFPMYRGLPSAQPDRLLQAVVVARQVMCLPIYPELKIGEVEKICCIIRN